MCTDLGPDLQLRCGSVVIPPLLEAMNDFQNPRVQVGTGRAYQPCRGCATVASEGKGVWPGPSDERVRYCGMAVRTHYKHRNALDCRSR